MHAGGDQKELDTMIGKLHTLRKELGVEDRPFQIHAASFLALTPRASSSSKTSGSPTR
jgi:hypothetical protein